MLLPSLQTLCFSFRQIFTFISKAQELPCPSPPWPLAQTWLLLLWRKIIPFQYRTRFKLTIVPKPVDWHVHERDKILPIHFLISVCSLSCLEGTLWSPGGGECWTFPWIIKDTFKGRSLQRLQEYRRSLCLHLEPRDNWSACFWQGSQSLPEFPVQQVRRGSTALQEGKTPPGTAQEAASPHWKCLSHQVRLTSAWKTSKLAKRQNSHKPINYKPRFFYLLHPIIFGSES